MLIEAHKADRSVPILSTFTLTAVNLPVALVGIVFLLLALAAIGAALVIGKAFETSGLASAAAGGMVDSLRPLGPVAVLAGIYLLTLVFTGLVTTNADAALAFPIALATERSMDVNVMPFAIAVAVAASAGSPPSRLPDAPDGLWRTASPSDGKDIAATGAAPC
jgi:di/tricarboxylate transporter